MSALSMKFRPLRVLVSACQEKKIVFGIVGVLLPMRFPNGTAGKRYRSEGLVLLARSEKFELPSLRFEVWFYCSKIKMIGK